MMESCLSKIPGIVVYLDDVIITNSTDEDHFSALEQVLQKLNAAGLQLKKEKCVFMAPSVDSLGH